MAGFIACEYKTAAAARRQDRFGTPHAVQTAYAPYRFRLYAAAR